MSSDPYAKALPGEKLTIHAAAWNRLIDTVRPDPSASPGEEFSYARTNFRVHCLNTAASIVPQWGVLKISDVLLGASGALTGTWSWPGVVGSPPESPGDACVVAVEPIASGGIGQAAVAGVVQTRLFVNCTGHQYARPRTLDTSCLETAEYGPFRILWRGSSGPANPTGVSGPSKPWAIVMFGNDRPSQDNITGYVANATQLLGHGKAVSGVTGCSATGYQWYSVTECSGNPSYATSYFL